MTMLSIKPVHQHALTRLKTEASAKFQHHGEATRLLYQVQMIFLNSKPYCCFACCSFRIVVVAVDGESVTQILVVACIE